MKPINRYTSHEFQEWHRDNSIPGLVVQDLDAWALPIGRPGRKPSVILELKRSTISVMDWRPFPADRNNYSTLLELCRAASIPLWVFYYRMGEPMHDGSLIHHFHMTEATPDYHGTHRVMTAGTWRDEYLAPLLALDDAMVAA